MGRRRRMMMMQRRGEEDEDKPHEEDDEYAGVIGHGEIRGGWLGGLEGGRRFGGRMAGWKYEVILAAWRGG